MKKFKLYSFITLLVLAFSFSLTSCGDDDKGIEWNQTNPQLLGMWELTEEHSVEYVDGKQVKESNEIKTDKRLEFLDDGTVVEFEKGLVGEFESWKQNERGIYTVSKKKLLYIQFEDSDIDTYEIKTLALNTLILVKTETEKKNGQDYKEVDTTTWTKKGK